MELADPSNPLLHKEREEGNVDSGELIRGMVDVKGRLDKISKIKEGRGKLVSAILEDESEGVKKENQVAEEKTFSKTDEDDKQASGEVKDIADMDRRVGELEKIIGSSNNALDEVSHKHHEQSLALG